MIEALWQRADEMDRRVEQVEDRNAIYRLLIDLQTAMDERDLDKYASFYTEDGEWSAVSGRAIGPTRISQFLRQYCKPWENEAQRSYHSISDVVIDVDGDSATARGQWRHDFPGDNGQPTTVHFGRFDAILRRTSDGWRIARRASYGLLPYIEPKFQLVGLTQAESVAPAKSVNKQTALRDGMTDAAKIELLRQRLDRLERHVGAAEDRDAVGRLFLDVQSAMDERDLEKYGQLYTDDGEWCAVNGRAIGPANITEHLKQYCKPWESEASRSYHSISDVTIDLHGDWATGHAQWQHNHPGENGHPVTRHFGHFDAVACRTTDGWRLERRASYLKIPYIEPEFQLIGLAELEAKERQRMSGMVAAGPSQDRGNGEAPDLDVLSQRLDDLARRFRQVEDRAAIYRKFIELQDATDARDGVRYGLCFTPDGTWSGVTGKAIGRDGITEYMSNYMTPWENEERRTFHSISDLTIDLDRDIARARAQYRHYRLGDDGRPEAFHFCHYDAILQRTSDGWLFKRRASYMDLPYVEPKYQLEDAG